MDKKSSKITILKEKICGLRYGQLILNASAKYHNKYPLKVANTLFRISNSDLQKAINEFLKEYEITKKKN